MPRVRLDTLLVDRGLVQSRERARALILAGQVRVEGVQVPKPGSSVDPNASNTAGRDHRIAKYKFFCDQLGVSYGNNLGC